MLRSTKIHIILILSQSIQYSIIHHLSFQLFHVLGIEDYLFPTIGSGVISNPILIISTQSDLNVHIIDRYGNPINTSSKITGTECFFSDEQLVFWDSNQYRCRRWAKRSHVLIVIDIDLFFSHKFRAIQENGLIRLEDTLSFQLNNICNVQNTKIWRVYGNEIRPKDV